MLNQCVYDKSLIANASYLLPFGLRNTLQKGTAHRLGDLFVCHTNTSVVALLPDKLGVKHDLCVNKLTGWS